jgi:hypothetical protein
MDSRIRGIEQTVADNIDAQHRQDHSDTGWHPRPGRLFQENGDRFTDADGDQASAQRAADAVG